MTTVTRTTRLIVSLALPVLLFSGCETVSTEESTQSASLMERTAERVPELQFRENVKQLRTGLSREEVTQLLGEPLRSESPGDDSAVVENWIYEIEHPPQFRTTTAEMEEVPWVDPITGEAVTLLEARPESERFQLVERFIIGFGTGGEVVDLQYQPERSRI